MQFILNCNTEATLGNPLVGAGKVLPGIVFVGFEVDKVEEARKWLEGGGVKVMSEEELAGEEWGIGGSRLFSSSKSLFLVDPDGNLLRLVEA